MRKYSFYFAFVKQDFPQNYSFIFLPCVLIQWYLIFLLKLKSFLFKLPSIPLKTDNNFSIDVVEVSGETLAACLFFAAIVSLYSFRSCENLLLVHYGLCKNCEFAVVICYALLPQIQASFRKYIKPAGHFFHISQNCKAI